MTDLELILNKGNLFKIKKYLYVYPDSDTLEEEVSKIVGVYTSEKEIKDPELLRRNIYTKEEVLTLIESGMKLEISEHLYPLLKEKEINNPDSLKEINNPDPLMKLVEDGAFSMEEASFMYKCFKKQNRDTFTFERNSCRITIKLFKEDK